MVSVAGSNEMPAPAKSRSIWPLAAMSAADMQCSVGAVSYTHLDVYKRQRLDGVLPRPEGGRGVGLVVREPRERDGERQLAYLPLRGAV